MIYEFFKTGLFSVGGGLATIPFLQSMGERYGWFTSETLSTMIAVSESTPGAMGVNMATYVGYHNAGLVGAIVTCLSLVAPSIIIICIIATMFDKFKKNRWVQYAFNGLRPSVVGFILAAVLDIFVLTLFNVEESGLTFIQWHAWVVLIGLFIIHKKVKLNPILVIIGCAFLGIIFQL